MYVYIYIISVICKLVWISTCSYLFFRHYRSDTSPSTWFVMGKCRRTWDKPRPWEPSPECDSRPRNVCWSSHSFCLSLLFSLYEPSPWRSLSRQLTLTPSFLSLYSVCTSFRHFYSFLFFGTFRATTTMTGMHESKWDECVWERKTECERSYGPLRAFSSSAVIFLEDCIALFRKISSQATKLSWQDVSNSLRFLLSSHQWERIGFMWNLTFKIFIKFPWFETSWVKKTIFTSVSDNNI